MTLLLVVFCLAGLLLVGLSVPLIRRKVPPNWLYGFRVPKTMNDPAVWYDANAYSARYLLGLGLAIAAAAVVLYFWPGMEEATYGYSVLAVFLVGMTIALVQSFRHLARLPSTPPRRDL